MSTTPARIQCFGRKNSQGAIASQARNNGQTRPARRQAFAEGELPVGLLMPGVEGFPLPMECGLRLQAREHLCN